MTTSGSLQMLSFIPIFVLIDYFDMTREEARARKDLDKRETTYRKSVSKKYGWKQSSYLNWKIEGGYYFSLFHCKLEDVWLEVKPLFVDDLWWDIFEIPENKQAPKSLRGIGAFSITGPTLTKQPVFDAAKVSLYSDDDIECVWDGVFRRIEQEISLFLKKNPNPERFSPEDGGEYGRIQPLYAILMELHSGNKEAALEKIASYKAAKRGSGFHGPKGDAYDYIEAWCQSN